MYILRDVLNAELSKICEAGEHFRRGLKIYKCNHYDCVGRIAYFMLEEEKFGVTENIEIGELKSHEWTMVSGKNKDDYIQLFKDSIFNHLHNNGFSFKISNQLEQYLQLEVSGHRRVLTHHLALVRYNRAFIEIQGIAPPLSSNGGNCKHYRIFDQSLLHRTIRFFIFLPRELQRFIIMFLPSPMWQGLTNHLEKKGRKVK